MTKSINALIEHATRTLPDSIQSRKRLLSDITNIISSKHPAYKLVRAQLDAIEATESLQRQLALKFQEDK